jgi:hypothetical protein
MKQFCQFTPKILFVGTDSHSAKKNSTEESNVENAHALPEKINVDDPCAFGEGLEKSTVEYLVEVQA